jgi:hypothetical protein
MIALMLALSAADQKPAAPPPAQTVQQQFDAATEAAADRRCAEAMPLFAALEQRPAIQRNRVASAAIAVRRAQCLPLGAFTPDVEKTMRDGIAVLAQKPQDFAVDIRSGHLTLGNAAESRFDVAGAAAEYRLALEGASAMERVTPLLALSRVLMFDGDGEAVRYAAEANTIAAKTAGSDRKDLAQVQTQYARALLNAGHTREAYDLLRDSLAKQGGLTTKVGVADIATRSDLAIAAWLSKDKDQARRYLAYTGAGRTPDSPFASAASMEAPSCGTESGLAPDDIAIVQFSIDDDGHVSGVTPIYVPAGRKAAMAFAAAVRDWSWRPEAIKKMPLLFRYTTRVEIRCTRAAERPSVLAPLEQAFEGWLDLHGAAAPTWLDRGDAAALPLQRAALARATSASDRPGMLRALVAMAKSSVVDRPTSSAYMATAVEIAATSDMPQAVRTYLRLLDLSLRSSGPGAYRAAVRPMLAEPATMADPLGAASLRLFLAAPGYRVRRPSDADALLDGVIDAPGLPARHPLKVSAMMQRANLLAEHGDVAGARAMFERTGLTEEQCALIQPSPAMRASGASSSDYPMAAIQMGFEGWVQTEFDIAPNGTTIKPRALVSYPPFVFDEAGEGIAKGMRYTSSYRPDGNLACAANKEGIKFLMNAH